MTLYEGERRVEGGYVQVVETEPGYFIAFWLEDPGTTPGGHNGVPEEIAEQGGEAALDWAEKEWNEKRLGRVGGG